MDCIRGTSRESSIVPDNGTFLRLVKGWPLIVEDRTKQSKYLRYLMNNLKPTEEVTRYIRSQCETNRRVIQDDVLAPGDTKPAYPQSEIDKACSRRTSLLVSVVALAPHRYVRMVDVPRSVRVVPVTMTEASELDRLSMQVNQIYRYMAPCLTVNYRRRGLYSLCID